MSNGECFDVARETVHGVNDFIDQYVTYTDSFVEAVIIAYGATDDAAESQAAWSECMADNGYTVLDRSELASPFLQDEMVSDEERSIMEIDLACDRSADLTQRRSAWQQSAIEAWRAEHEAERVALDAAAAQFDEILQGLEDETL